MTEGYSLKELKEAYEKLAKKYKLPSFHEMNEDFEIEKLQEHETNILTREIRRAMMDRNVSYLRFIEMFQNPGQAPMFFLALIKSVDSSDKQLIDELYLELGKYEIKSIALDNEYSEEKDIEFIKKFYKGWQNIKKKFGKLMNGLEKAWEKKVEKKDKGYLG